MSESIWQNLRLSQIDLHFHAGSERPEGSSINDFLRPAYASGRRVVGVTDHFWYFLGMSDRPPVLYQNTLEGYRALAEDVDAARGDYPDMALYFGPEINMVRVMNDMCIPAFDAPGVTHFYAEPHAEFCTDEHYIRGFERIAELRAKYGVPAGLVHPLRVQIGKYFKGRRDNGAGEGRPLDEYRDPAAHLKDVFQIDPVLLAKEAVEYDVPIELNGGSWNNIVARNSEWFAERFLFFYRTLIEHGVRITLGSDLHGAGAAMPSVFVPAMMLGLKTADLDFIQEWLPGTAVGSAS